MGKLIVPNTDALLDPAFARSEVHEHFADQLELGRELTRELSSLIQRVFLTNDRKAQRTTGLEDLVVGVVLPRHCLVGLDACFVCLAEGAVEAAHVHVRMMLEASLYIDWILRANAETRARRYYVWGLRQERYWQRRVIPGTKENNEYVAAWKSSFHETPSQHAEVVQAATQRDAAITRYLESAKLRDVNAEFDAAIAKGRQEKAWHAVGDDGVSSLYRIAQAVGREAEYAVNYKSLSYVAHGSRFGTHVKTQKGGVTIEPVRRLKDFGFVFTNATQLAVRTIRGLTTHYRKEELPQLQERHLRWRQRLGVPEVVENAEYVRY